VRLKRVNAFGPARRLLVRARRAHLWFFDRRYLAHGSLKNFKEKWGE
jgi:hypothetical protein